MGICTLSHPSLEENFRLIEVSRGQELPKPEDGWAEITRTGWHPRFKTQAALYGKIGSLTRQGLADALNAMDDESGRFDFNDSIPSRQEALLSMRAAAIQEGDGIAIYARGNALGKTIGKLQAMLKSGESAALHVRHHDTWPKQNIVRADELNVSGVTNVGWDIEAEGLLFSRDDRVKSKEALEKIKGKLKEQSAGIVTKDSSVREWLVKPGALGEIRKEVADTGKRLKASWRAPCGGRRLPRRLWRRTIRFNC